MTKNTYSVDFLMHTKQKTAKWLHIFAIITLLANMTMAGIIVAPEAAQACHGTVKIIKVTDVASSEEFHFSGDFGDFVLSHGSDPADLSFSKADTYVITEAAALGWELESISCISSKDSNYDYSFDLDAGELTLDIYHDNTIECTFVNNQTEPEPVCGDGVLDEATEDCDDGNTEDGDGCDATCHIEDVPEPGKLSGYKWDDQNGNGLKDGDEPGLENWTIYIDANANFELDKNTSGQPDELYAQTNADGFYRIINLEAGDYTVCEEMKEGWEQIYPGDNGCHVVTVGAGTETTDNNFGNKQLPPPPSCGDGNLDAGEDCDDGNNIDGDGCSANCTIEEPESGQLEVIKIVVGGPATSTDFTMHIGTSTEFAGSADGVTADYAPGEYNITESGLYLDDYVLSYSGGCDASGTVNVAKDSLVTCTLTNVFIPEQPVCGNGEVEGEEVCDTGTDNGLVCDALYGGSCTYCSDECTEATVDGPFCGDGALDPEYEECEDGNNVSGDGCSAACTTEGGGGPDPYCGDGKKNGNEECDGNAGVPEGKYCNDACELRSYGSTPIFPPSRFGGNPPVVYGEQGQPQLAIEKTSLVNMANAGDVVEYKIVITNNGNLTAYNAVLSDHLPEGFKYEDSSAGVRTWQVGDMEPGKIFIYDYRVVIDSDANSGRYVNIAELKADNAQPVIDDAFVDVREVVVQGISSQEELPVTGFSVNELLMLLLGLVFLGGCAKMAARSV